MRKKNRTFTYKQDQLETFPEDEIHFEKPTVQQSLDEVGWTESSMSALILKESDFHFSYHIFLAVYIGSFAFFLC